MARKKKDPRQEELELEQAYVELTGYNIERKKSKAGGLIAAICILAVILAGCVLAIPMLLESEQTPTESTGPDLIAPGTTVLGVDLSGMSHSQAADAVNAFDAEGAAAVLLDDPRLFDINDWSWTPILFASPQTVTKTAM